MFSLVPAGEGKTFDSDYYATKHLALVHELVGPMKLLRGASMHKSFAGPTPGVAAAYLGGAVLLFDTVEDSQTVMAKRGAALMADAPNFTHSQPGMDLAEVTATV